MKNSPPPSSLRQAWTDLALIALAALLCFVMSSQLELSEKLTAFFIRHESWQLDEWPLSLLVFSLGLCWFAFRRAHEAHRALTERQSADEQVAELLRRNRDLSQRLILVQEDERRALARELHDEFGQSCTAIRTDANYIFHARPGDDAGILASARRIDHTAHHLHALCRGMLARLRPPALDSLGLTAALQELCESWEEQTGVACHFFPQDVPLEVSDAIAVTCYRLVQEALTNVTRHAGASQVRIDLGRSADAGSVKLRIEDDGCGMTAPQAFTSGLGIVGMRERVAALHGEISLAPATSHGLRIEATLPLNGPAA
jgi:two-component system sensor histidine kinase UhpB